jgi:putative two-component system response regulator
LERVLRVVLIDDSKSVLAALNAALRDLDDIEIIAFTDSAEALQTCLRKTADVMIVDYTMPGYNGAQLIQALKVEPEYRLVPVIMLTSEKERRVRIEALEAGATEFLTKPFDTIELQARVRNLMALRKAQLALADHAKRLAADVARATKALAAREEEIIWRLARAIEYRDGSTGDHVSRVAMVSRLLALELGLGEERSHMIYLAAPLHDIGKIGIADSVLLKPGRLTSDEISQMREHVEIGARILADGSSELVQVAAAIASGHHEKWDGSGYPRGLSGETISLEARIVAVADVFEALCTERSYKKAWPVQEAFQHIVAESGRHFDPRCVEAFERQWDAISALIQPPAKDDTAPSIDPSAWVDEMSSTTPFARTSKTPSEKV